MIWVLFIISGINTSTIQVFINTFDSKAKCEKRLTEMHKGHTMACISTELNK